MINNNELFTPTKLFCGVIYNSDTDLSFIKKQLEQTFKLTIDQYSTPRLFNHSSYYNLEMGDVLNRVFFSFHQLIAPDDAYTYKQKSVQLENCYKKNNKRQFNLDPGILTLHNIILYSTKNFSHRIACKQGIYAEVTCLLKKNKVTELPWTYPDFKQESNQHFFLTVRKSYHKELRRQNYV